MRIAICGPGKCGKSTTSYWLRDNLGLQYDKSTSEFAADVVFEKLKDTYGYPNSLACWSDRRNHRVEWGSLIAEHNQSDGVQLYRDMLATHDIIDGIRRGVELVRCHELGLVDLSVWIERDVPPDDSLDYTMDVCDVTITNNGTIPDLYRKLTKLASNGLFQ